MNSTFSDLNALSIGAQPLGIWAYILIGLLVAVEGPITILAAGVASAGGFLNPVIVFFTACTGNLTADTLWYLLGYLGKTDWIMRYGAWTGITQEHIDKMEKDIHEHSRKILFVAKISVGLVIPALIATGMACVPWKRWFWVVAIAEAIWTGALVTASYYYGYIVLRLDQDLKLLSIVSSVIILVVIIFYFSRWRSRQEKQ